jgi:hypothetical protein
MSSAFVREGDETLGDLPDRRISPHTNDVPPQGLTHMEVMLDAAPVAHAAGRWLHKTVAPLRKHPEICATGVHERKPDFVGVDPYVKLISRNTAGNVAPLGHKSGGS